MHFETVISMLPSFLLLGIIFTAILLFIITIGYTVFCKTTGREKKKLKLSKLFVLVINICYVLVILAATVITRDSYSQSRELEFNLISSYRSAWNNWSMREWRYMILNILMFVPFGFLFPLISRKLQSFWKVYLSGFILTLFVEMLQYATGRGICETADLFHNLLGTMIGYGVFCIVMYLYKRMKRQEVRGLYVLLFQIPLILLLTLYGIIFLAYSAQEYGNLSISYSEPANIYETSITLSTALSSESDKKIIYKNDVLSKDDTHVFASEFFHRLGMDVNSSDIDYYDQTAVYRSEDSNYHLWVEYFGGTFDFTDFSVESNNNFVEDATTEDILNLLRPYGVSIPKIEGNEFEYCGDGTYNLSLDQYIDGDTMYDGSLSVRLENDNEISHIGYDIIPYKVYKECNISTPVDAYNEIVDGKFSIDTNSTLIYSIEILDVDLIYSLDSKGFLRPVYQFTANVDGCERQILIPAKIKE